jgi:DNA repair exonuclease SbcCD ATPase subunit
MEKELLNQMIYDRDRRIASIKQKMEDQHQKMVKFQDELVEIKKRREESEIAHMEELTRLMEEREVGDRQLWRLQEDLKKQQGDSLQLYAEVIKKGVAKVSNAKDSSYVMRMQAQLCKCMHSMGIMENQTELVKATCDQLIKSLKEAVNQTIDEKTNVELQFMNELVMTDNSRREVEEKMNTKLDKLQDEIARLEEKLADRDSDTESDSEVDEEEEEEKRELKKELKERNEEIEALQKQIDAQKARIHKLESGVDLDDSKFPAEDDEEDDINEATEDESTDSQ